MPDTYAPYSHQHAITSGPRMQRGGLSARPWLGLYLAEQEVGYGYREPIAHGSPLFWRRAWHLSVPMGVDVDLAVHRSWGLAARCQMEVVDYPLVQRAQATSVTAHW